MESVERTSDKAAGVRGLDPHAPLQVSPDIVFRPEYFGGLLFSRKTLSILEINGATSRLLAEVDGTRTPSQIVQAPYLLSHHDRQQALAALRELADLGILTPSGASQRGLAGSRDFGHFSDVGRLSAPLGVSIEITDRCNLRCRYCFQGTNRVGQLLSKEEILGLLDELADLKVFTVFFGGGEPTLSPHFRGVAEYAIALEFAVGVSTNGTLISPDLAEWFSTSGIDRGLQVSVDGSSALYHDVHRGDGTFAKVVEGIRTLSAYGVHPSLAVTVTRLNIRDVPNMIAFAEREAARHLHLMCLLPSGSALSEYDELCPDLEEWRWLINELKKESGAPERSITVDWGNWCYLSPTNDLAEADYSQVDLTFSGCPAGKTKAVIGGSGDVFGCDVLKRPELVAGNVRRDAFADIWRNSAVFGRWRARVAETIKGKCVDCKWRFACVGGCPAVSLHHGLDIFHGDPACPHDPNAGVYFTLGRGNNGESESRDPNFHS